MKTLILSLVLVLLNGSAAGVSNNDIVDYHGSLNSVENSAYHSTVNTMVSGTEKQMETLSDMYDEISDEELSKFDDMDVESVKDKIDGFECKYKVGESFSEEDQALLLYAYNEYGGAKLDSGDTGNEAANIAIDNVANVWRSYNIGSSKSKLGVKTTYQGKLKTRITASGGKYYTTVKSSWE